jgi:hypothetical protein
VTTQFKKTRWRSGLVFALPLADGSFGLAQAIAPVQAWAVDLALFSDRFLEIPTEVPSLQRANLISIHATWQRVLNGGHWATIGSAPCVITTDECPNQKLVHLGENGGGCQYSSQEILQDFLSAYHGIIPWNLFPASDFDQKLCYGVDRPKTARLLDEASLWLFQQAEQGKTYHA